MRHIQSIVCVLLLILMPTTPVFSRVSYKSLSQPQMKDLHLMSFDEILNLLDEIETGELEKKCSFEDLERISGFLALLAKEGAESKESILYENIAILTHIPDFEIVLCGDWWSSSWKNTKAFVANHKKEIITGAVIVVAVVTIATIATVVGTTAASAAAASAVAAVADGLESEKDQYKTASTSPPEMPAAEIAVNNASLLKEMVSEKFEPIKTLNRGDHDPSFKEKVREVGAILTHEALDAVAELMSAAPQLQQEIIELAEKILPVGSIPEEVMHHIENFEKIVSAGHEKIDLAFATHQAHKYTQEQKTREDQYVTRMELPVPTFSSPSSINSKIAKAATVEEGYWSLPKKGGGTHINGRWYTEHALERMAPNTPGIMAELESRALKRAQAENLEPCTEEFGRWMERKGPNPRGIPPSIIEAEILNPGSTNVEVVLNNNGDVITIFPKGN